MEKEKLFETCNEYGYCIRIFKTEKGYTLIFFNKNDKVCLHKVTCDTLGKLTLGMHKIKRDFNGIWIKINGYNRILDIEKIYVETIEYINTNKSNRYYQCRNVCASGKAHIHASDDIQSIKKATRTRGGNKK